MVRSRSPAASGMRNLLLEPLEHLDVARHGGLLEEEQVVRLERAGELDQHGRRDGAVGVEHDRAARPDLLARGLDGRDDPLDVRGRAAVFVGAAGRQLLRLRRVVDANPVAGRAAEQPVNRRVPQLAGEVPQRDVDARDACGS